MYKIIYEEKQTAITSDSENVNFPATNLLDDKPKKLWKAVTGDNTATLSVTVSAGVKAIGIFNTNATSCVINGTTTLSSLTYNRIWYEFSASQSAGTITLALTSASGTTVYAGVVVAGAVTTLGMPQVDITEELIDYSVITQLSSGSEHVRIGEICRQFSASQFLTRDTQWLNLLNLYLDNGQQPLGMLLGEVGNNYRWCGFFKMFPIKANHITYTHSRSNFIIKEVI